MVEKETEEYINTINNAIIKLNKIALKPTSDSTDEYINEMIKTVKEENRANKEE